MPLDKLPKSFGLKEMKKGYFPHLYNTQQMNNLEGSKFLPHLPPLKFYNVDNMNIENLNSFQYGMKIINTNVLISMKNY